MSRGAVPAAKAAGATGELTQTADNGNLSYGEELMEATS